MTEEEQRTLAFLRAEVPHLAGAFLAHLPRARMTTLGDLTAAMLREDVAQLDTRSRDGAGMRRARIARLGPPAGAGEEGHDAVNAPGPPTGAGEEGHDAADTPAPPAEAGEESHDAADTPGPPTGAGKEGHDAADTPAPPAEAGEESHDAADTPAPPAEAG
ncbi:MAG: hypothetical protein ACRD0K_26165, partial [Egibacteraceae bacterium]